MYNNIITNENYYLISDARINFYFYGEINGYIIESANGKTEKLFIPDTINGKSVKDFSGDLNLTGFDEVCVSKNNSYLTAVDGVLFTKNMKKSIIYPPEKINEKYVVPAGVE